MKALYNYALYSHHISNNPNSRMVKSLLKELDSKFKWDIFWVGIIQIANYIFPFLTTTYLIRTIGLSRFGKTEFATLITLYFITITNYEFHVSGTRDISRIHDQPQKLSDTVSVIITTKTYLFFLSTLIFLLLLWIYPSMFYNWLFLSTYLIVTGHLLYQPYTFQALGKIRVLAILNLLIKVISTTLIFIVIKSGDDFESVNLNYSISYILIGIISIFLAWHYFKLTFSWKRFAAVKECLRNGFYIFLTNGLLYQLTLNLSAIMLGLYLDSSVLGSYSAALKIVIALHVIMLLPLKQVFFPTLNLSWINDKADYLKKFRAYTFLILWSNLLLAGALLLLAPYIVRIFYGSYFPQIIYIIRMLAFLPLLAALSNAYINDGLIIMGNDKLVFVIQFLSASINILLLLIFMPLFGLTAVLIIKIIVDLVTLSAGIFFYYRKLNA